MLRVLVFLVPIAITIYGLIDALMAPSRGIRLLPKALWVFVILVLPLVGAVMWFILGRPLGASMGRGSHRSIGPDDDPGFLASLRDRKPR